MQLEAESKQLPQYPPLPPAHQHKHSLILSASLSLSLCCSLALSISLSLSLTLFLFLSLFLHQVTRSRSYFRALALSQSQIRTLFLSRLKRLSQTQPRLKRSFAHPGTPQTAPRAPALLPPPHPGRRPGAGPPGLRRPASTSVDQTAPRTGAKQQKNCQRPVATSAVVSALLRRPGHNCCPSLRRLIKTYRSKFRLLEQLLSS